jgi:hypothetical protein
MIEVRPFVSHELGLLPYPVGTIESTPPNGHIMAATALAWLCDLPVERWGEPWATGGTIDLRFRSHLAAGLAVELVGEPDEDGIDLTVRLAGRTDESFVTGRATLPSEPAKPPLLPVGAGPAEPAAPDPAGIAGLVLRPVTFEFDAARDLRLCDHLQGGEFWLRRGWAHPGWFATAANAAARLSLELQPEVWMYAGVRIDLHQPTPDGSVLTIGGRVAELFESRRHRFAVCELAVHEADLGAVASMRTTFVYGVR